MIKRSLDIAISAIALIILSPVIMAVALLIRIRLGRPVLFVQQRPGKNGAPFNLIKFRTMKEASGNDGVPLPDGERLSSFGQALRSMSLDEVPGLWNVLKGEMSLVGPRPLLMDYLPLYSAQQNRRHKVLPGITGWAQVNGRNAISWDQKFAADVWYVDNQSLFLDFKILFLTIKKVIKREGVSSEGEATMPRFKGAAKK